MGSRIAFLLVVLGVFLWGWPIASDNDIYFHLAAGKAVVEKGGPLFHDIFTYTATGRPDESWHSWGSQAIFYLLYQKAGFSALRGLNFLLLAITLLTAVHFTWKKTGSQTAALIAGTWALLIHHHVQVLRPLLFGEALFAITAFEIIPWGNAMSPRRLVAGGLIAVLWANLHGSVVILPFLFALHSITQWKTTWLTRLSPLFIFLATCLNPLGTALFPYAIDLTREGKIAGGWDWAGARPLEWKRTFAELPAIRWHLDVPSLTLVFGGLWFFFRKGYQKYPMILPFLALPVLSARHVVYLIFPAAILAARFCKKIPPILGWTICVTCLFIFRFNESYDVSPSIGKATNFLAESHIEGNVLTDPAWANYLTFRLFPKVHIAYDTRTLVHRDFYRRSAVLFNEFGKEAWLILLDHPPQGTRLLITRSLGESPDSSKWLPVYGNNHALISVRKTDDQILELVSNYYRERNIPFSKKEGFLFSQVVRKAPHWFSDQQEENEWGKWPEPAASEIWRQNQKRFYEQKVLLGQDLG